MMQRGDREVVAENLRTIAQLAQNSHGWVLHKLVQQ